MERKREFINLPIEETIEFLDLMQDGEIINRMIVKREEFQMLNIHTPHPKDKMKFYKMKIKTYKDTSAHLSCINENCCYRETIFKSQKDNKFYRKISKNSGYHVCSPQSIHLIPMSKAQREYIHGFVKNKAPEWKNQGNTVDVFKSLLEEESLLGFKKLGGAPTIFKNQVENIIKYKRSKDQRNFHNDIDYLVKNLGEYLIDYQSSAFCDPYFIAADKQSFYDLVRAEHIYMDKTYTRGNDGVYVISTKTSYDLLFTHDGKRKRGKKCFPSVYIYTKSQDGISLQHILQIIKIHVEDTVGTNWNPKYITIDFDQAEVKSISSVFPTTLILFCFFHFMQAHLRHSKDSVFHSKYLARVLGIELRRFWRNTKDIFELHENLLILEQNLLKLFNGIDNVEQCVSSYMTYFRSTYVDCRHFLPIRWLHIGLKESQFHDPTNNTSESLNKVLKMNSKKNLTFENVVKKIYKSILYYKSQSENLSQSHNKKF